ncbi:hypothetical protein [Rhizobium leguminosarum]|uniref:hypothetical protein n=1 Tax=Rhizobium leguminosarum TaxID=384 RepID=UPI001C97A579|nr:hypothetical protein [Rhizobium leguminosarum]MBY5827577.1 hypothetical protein [Rhizobium leguminosarum]
MDAVVATITMTAARRRLKFRYSYWRIAHSVLAIVIVSSSATHALLTDGVMGEASKLAVAIMALATTTFAAFEINVLTPARARQGKQQSR